MAFLSGIISSVVMSLLSAVGGWLIHYFQVAAKDAADQKAADAATLAAIAADKGASTKEERDNAAKGISDNL